MRRCDKTVARGWRESLFFGEGVSIGIWAVCISGEDTVAPMLSSWSFELRDIWKKHEHNTIKSKGENQPLQNRGDDVLILAQEVSVFVLTFSSAGLRRKIAHMTSSEHQGIQVEWQSECFEMNSFANNSQMKSIARTISLEQEKRGSPWNFWFSKCEVIPSRSSDEGIRSVASFAENLFCEGTRGLLLFRLGETCLRFESFWKRDLRGEIRHRDCTCGYSAVSNLECQAKQEKSGGGGKTRN